MCGDCLLIIGSLKTTLVALLFATLPCLDQHRVGVFAIDSCVAVPGYRVHANRLAFPGHVGLRFGEAVFEHLGRKAVDALLAVDALDHHQRRQRPAVLLDHRVAMIQRQQEHVLELVGRWFWPGCHVARSPGRFKDSYVIVAL